MSSIKPGKQRKMLYNAPIHKKSKWMSSHLEENLLLKYNRRSIPVIKGDIVKVMRGSFRGHEDKVAKANVKKCYLEIEGITMSKADGNKIAKPIHPSNVMITKLNLTDKWRRKTLEQGLSEEAKKEMEKEAEEQIKEAKALEKKKELEREKEELEKKEAEEAPTEKKEEETKEKAPADKKSEEKVEQKKKKTTKKPATKKPTAKKEPAKKKSTKKSTSTKKKKEK
mgnify:CR=1 FL=1